MSEHEHEHEHEHESEHEHEHEQDQPIDFAGLDPTLDGVRFQGTVRRIMDQARPILAGRRAGSSHPGELGAVAAIGSWWRPLTAAAAALALGSATLLSGVRPAASPSADTGTFAEAMGEPGVLAGWVQSEEAPATSELFELY